MAIREILNHPKKLDKAVKISAIVGILVVSAFIMNYFFIVLPSQKERELKLKQVELVSSKNKILGEENISAEAPVEEKSETADLINFDSYDKKINEKDSYVADINDKTSNYQSQDYKKASKSTAEEDTKNYQEIAKTEDYNKTQGQNYETQLEIAYESQLKADMEAYNSTIEKLTRDYNHDVDAINARAIEEGAYEIDHDCADGTMDEHNCQIIQRKYEKYKVELEYLSENYNANLKAIQAIKYW